MALNTTVLWLALLVPLLLASGLGLAELWQPRHRRELLFKGVTPDLG